MALNYRSRLENLKQRKFDPETGKYLLGSSFGKGVLPENIEYLLESTKPIDPAYNSKTTEAAGRVKNHLESGFSLHFGRNYEFQGSVMTKTNIKAHSDIDLLSIVDRYFFLGPDLPNTNPYNETDPDDDMVEFRKQAVKILKNKYDQVDDSGTKCVSIFNQNLKRKVDIVFAFWLDTSQYRNNNNNKYYRGIYLYDFQKHSKEKDFPFATIDQVNLKGQSTNDGSRRGIRLIKNLRSDSDSKIDLNSFQLTSIVHDIDDSKLYFVPGAEVQVAQAVSDQLYRLINDKQYRLSVSSPNGMEAPFADDSCIIHLQRLKGDLDELIRDCNTEFSNHYIKNAVLAY